jgi:protein SCO1/2
MRRQEKLALVAGALLFALSVAAGDQTPAPDEHHRAVMNMSADEHAAHRAASSTNHYAVSMKDYDVPQVELVDANGSLVDLRSLLDSERPVALNFIFTTCTTICPVMTATFAQMQRQLGDAADGLRLVSISIDPEYDRPDVLRAYAAQFHAHGNWTFLTGDSRDIRDVLQSFDSYAGSKMNHQPVTFLRNPGGPSWVRIDGLPSGESLAQEVTARLLN